MTAPDVSITAFLPFYRHLISRDTVRARLHEPIAAVSDPQHTEGLLDRVWTDLAGTVEGHSFRMLIGEFHAFQDHHGLPRTADGDEALQLFRRHLQLPGTSRQLLDRFPVLRQRLTTILDNSLAAYADLFRAYAADRAVLLAAGLISAGDDAVADLFGTGGDLHNDNQKVVGVRLSGGTRLIFKPRALVSDHFVRDLYAATDAHLTYSLRECLPASVSVGSHGWQQFVTPAAMTGPDQPARYYYRFGALCAILGSIGASDLHDENLLAAGENPCVIDTETVVRPDAGVALDSLPHVLINQLKLSVGSTMLVPMTDPTSRNDLNMAGVGVDGVQTSSMRRPVVRDGDTDRISVRWEPVSYRHRDNVPRLGDTALSPVDHFPDLMAGYVDALTAVRDDGVRKVLDSYPDMPVRCLLRSTMVYARFLDAATHPDYLGSAEEAERILRLLGAYPPFLSPEAVAFLGDAERASLRTGNVPYFTARGGSTELATPTARVPDVYTWSALEFARRGVTLAARRTDLYHRFLMEECFGEIAAGRPAALAAHGVFAGTSTGARATRWWPAIARTIGSLGVDHDGPDGPEMGWVCGIGSDRGASTLTPGNYVSFHDSGGIVTFLEHAARRDPGLRESHRGADRGFDTLLAEYGDGLLQAPEGVLTGAASVLLVRPSRVDPAWLNDVLDRIDERAAAGTLETDLGNGPAGLLMVLLSRQESGERPLIDAQRFARLLGLVGTHQRAPRTAPWFDVAHGDLGLRWAQSRIGRVLGDDDLPRSSADWLIGRLSGDLPPPVPGWCNGTAGLLLTAAEILVSADRQEWLSAGRMAAMLDRATRLPADRPIDVSVCHGSSGVIQSLIAASRLLGEPSLLERAADYQDRVIGTIQTNGFHTGSAGRTSLLGYMLGWSGVGDTDLMLGAALEGARPLPLPVALTAVPHDHSTGDFR